LNGKLGLGAENGGLYLVTGADKTSNWCAAAYADGPRVAALEFVEHEGQYLPRSSGIVEERTAILPESPEAQRENQCVFIRGYRVALSRDLFSKDMVKPGETYGARPSKPISYLFPEWLTNAVSALWRGSTQSQGNGEYDSGIVVEMFPELTEVHVSLFHVARTRYQLMFRDCKAVPSVNNNQPKPLGQCECLALGHIF